MKRIILLLAMLSLTVSVWGQKTEVYVIGVVKEPHLMINPDSIFAVIEDIAPKAILYDLEMDYFTVDGDFNLAKHPDMVNTNERLAGYRYQQSAKKVGLRPYDKEGTRAFYDKNNYFERKRDMQADVVAAYEAGSLSAESKVEWDNYLKLVDLLGIDPDVNSLREINTIANVAYADAINNVFNKTMLSITKRDFPLWVGTAEMIDLEWVERNDEMAEHIVRLCELYRKKRIIVFCEYQYKQELLRRLEPQQKAHKFKLVDF